MKTVCPECGNGLKISKHKMLLSSFKKMSMISCRSCGSKIFRPVILRFRIISALSYLLSFVLLYVIMIFKVFPSSAADKALFLFWSVILISTAMVMFFLLYITGINLIWYLYLKKQKKAEK